MGQINTADYATTSETVLEECISSNDENLKKEILNEVSKIYATKKEYGVHKTIIGGLWIIMIGLLTYNAIKTTGDFRWMAFCLLGLFA